VQRTLRKLSAANAGRPADRLAQLARGAISPALVVPSDTVKSGCSRASDDVLQAYLVE